MRRTRFHNGKPRGPRSAYNLFFRDTKVLVTGKAGRASMIAEQWRNLEAGKRVLYTQRARQDKLRYGLELVKWKQSAHYQDEQQKQRAAMQLPHVPQDVRPTTEPLTSLIQLRLSKRSFGNLGSVGDTAQIKSPSFCCGPDRSHQVEKHWPLLEGFNKVEPVEDPLFHWCRASPLAHQPTPEVPTELVDSEVNFGDTAPADGSLYPYLQDGQRVVGDPCRIVEDFTSESEYNLSEPEYDPLLHPGRLSQLAKTLGPQGVSHMAKLFRGLPPYP